jgi:hypothetical protein
MLKNRLSAAAVPGALAIVVLFGGATATAAGAAAKAPSALVAASLAAAAKQNSVHYVATSSLGSQSITIVADAARAKGQQVITIRKGKQVGTVAARYDGKAVYFRANTIGLEGYLGMPNNLAPKYSGKWISFSPSQQDFSQIAKSMTITSAIGEISLSAPVKAVSPITVNGTQAVGVTGTTTSLSSSGAKGKATLYMVASGTPLPVVFTGKGSQKGQTEAGRVAFSRWGERVAPVTPKGAVSAASISAANGSSSSGSTSSTGTPTTSPPTTSGG